MDLTDAKENDFKDTPHDKRQKPRLEEKCTSLAKFYPIFGAEDDLKNENDPKNENYPKNEDDLKILDDLKNLHGPAQQKLVSVLYSIAY